MTKDAISPAEEHEFAAVVEAAEREQYGTDVPDPVARMEFINQLLEQVDDGWVPHRGKWYRVIQPERAADDMTEVKAEARQRPGPSRKLIASLIALPLLLGALAWVLLNDAAPMPANGFTPAPGAAPQSLATLTANSSLTTTLIPAPTIAAGFATGQGEPAWPRHPNSLKLGGRIFGVYQAPIAQNVWQVAFNPGFANWVKGATLNWSFAIYLEQDADSNVGAWLNSLQPTQTLVEIPVVEQDLHINKLVFRLTERQVIDRTQTDKFDPTFAGATILIHRDYGDNWIALRATEVVSDTMAPVGGKRGATP